MAIEIYNLLFPAYINELSLDGYTFTRVEDYERRAQSLNHTIDYSDEFQFNANFGNHAITANVSPPDPEPPPSIGWANPGATRLNDILLILSLFTMRNVWKREEGIPISEHRCYQYGLQLSSELPFIKDPDTPGAFDIGFEPGISRVLTLIRGETWKIQYEKGHYLQIANHAFRWQIIETTFSLCWTIWEHLFAVHNRDWLSKESIHRLSGMEKIAFLRSHYDLEKYSAEIINAPLERIRNIRNRLIHYGKFPDEDSLSIADDFVKWTQYLIAATLNLKRETFNSLEDFEANGES